MKKLLSVFLSIILVGSLFVGCRSKKDISVVPDREVKNKILVDDDASARKADDIITFINEIEQVLKVNFQANDSDINLDVYYSITEYGDTICIDIGYNGLRSILVSLYSMGKMNDWYDCINCLVDLSVAIKEEADSYFGTDGVAIMFTIVNDEDPDNPLAVIVNDKLIYEITGTY